MNSTVIDNQRSALSRHHQFLIVGIAVATIVRLLLLGSKSLWLDEANSLRITSLGQTALWTGGSELYHPPLFYILLEQWMELGRSEWVLRLPSALLGVVSCVLIYYLAKDLFSAESALSALWLAALSPLLVWYAQELRSYMLVLVFALLATWATVRLLRTAHLGWLMVLFVSMTAAIYTHYSAFLMIPIQFFLVIVLSARGQSTRRGVLSWVLVWLPIGLAYLPWASTVSARAFWGILTSNQSYVADLLLVRFGIVYQQFVWLVVFGGAVAAVVVYALTYWIARRHGDRLQWLRAQGWLQWMLVVGFVLVLAAEVYPRGYSLKRQLTLFWPFGLMILAWFWPWQAAQRRKLIVVLSAAFVATLIAVTLVPKDQWREAVAYINAQAQEGDIVLLTPTYMTIPFDFYNQGRVAIEGIDPVVENVVAQSEGHPRVWLVAHMNDIADPQNVIDGWLTENASLAAQTSFHNIRVNLYEQ